MFPACLKPKSRPRPASRLEWESRPLHLSCAYVRFGYRFFFFISHGSLAGISSQRWCISRLASFAYTALFSAHLFIDMHVSIFVNKFSDRVPGLYIFNYPFFSTSCFSSCTIFYIIQKIFGDKIVIEGSYTPGLKLKYKIRRCLSRVYSL